MASPLAEPSAAAAPLGAAALALLLIVLATDAAAQSSERLWTVTCGLPQQDNPILDFLPSAGYTGPWGGDPRSGHLEVKTLNRPHPESGLSTEMWLLSRTVGWWMLKSIRVHPDDLSKLSENMVEDGSLPDIRQIIDSPFLSRPAVVRAGDTDDEEFGEWTDLGPAAGRLSTAVRPVVRRIGCCPQRSGVLGAGFRCQTAVTA